MENLEPGTPVPRTGTYVCCWCGPGGMAQSMVGPTIALQPSVTILLNAHLRLPGADRLTVFELAEGQTFPACPTCATATGWDLLTGSLEDLLRGRIGHREGVFGRLGIAREPLDPRETDLNRLTITTDPAAPPNPPSATQPAAAPCDVCGAGVPAGAGHLLPTQEILVSEAYWVYMIRMAAKQLENFPDRRGQESYLSELLRAREGDRTPWMVCDNCTEYFIADWAEAHEHVVRGTKPRGPGRFRNRFSVADYVLVDGVSAVPGPGAGSATPRRCRSRRRWRTVGGRATPAR